MQTWMIMLYFVIDDTPVTKQADINRKELAMELSMFCFQVVSSFWAVILMVTIIHANRNSRYEKSAQFIFGTLIFLIMVLLYSDCLQLLF